MGGIASRGVWERELRNAATVGKIRLVSHPQSDSLPIHPVFVERETIAFVFKSSASSVACPDCGQPTDRIRSRYRRQLADLPWQKTCPEPVLVGPPALLRHVELTLVDFHRTIPEVVAPRARTTLRLDAAYCLIGLALDGEAGELLRRRVLLALNGRRRNAAEAGCDQIHDM